MTVGASKKRLNISRRERLKLADVPNPQSTDPFITARPSIRSAWCTPTLNGDGKPDVVAETPTGHLGVHERNGVAPRSGLALARRHPVRNPVEGDHNSEMKSVRIPAAKPIHYSGPMPIGFRFAESEVPASLGFDT